MGKMLRLMAVFLAIGTVVWAMAVVYVVGVEQGVNSVLLNWLPYMHPLRNFLFGSALFIGICWIAFFIATSLQAKKKGFFCAR
jgi:hypothetical protein